MDRSATPSDRISVAIEHVGTTGDGREWRVHVRWQDPADCDIGEGRRMETVTATDVRTSPGNT